MRKIILVSLLILSFLDAKEKMVLLNVQMHGCGWCAKMQREVFDNPKVMAKLKKRFRVVLLNRDEDPLPRGVNPHLFPTTYVMTPDMKVVDDELKGYIGAKELLNYFNLE